MLRGVTKEYRHFSLKKFFHDLFLRSMTCEYMGLPWVTGGYKGLQGVTRGYRGLQGVTRGDRGFTTGYGGLQRIIETFF